jgi:hypothetical protein
MQDKDTTKSTFIQLFKPVLSKKFFQRLKELNVDKYVKKLKTTQLIGLLSLAQIEQQRGLRDISNSLNNDELSKAINLESISASQVSRRLRNLPTAVIQELFDLLNLEVGKKIGFEKIRNVLGKINLIDSSTISMCVSRYPWAEFRKTKSGVKLHLRLRFSENGVAPAKAIVTPARPADKTQMDDLVVEEKDALNVFDRAYVDYKKFDNYCEKGIRFVTRLKENAIVNIVQEIPLEPESPVKKEYIVYLGAEGINKMQHPLRLLKTIDTQGKEILILTNDFTLDAGQIGDIYRNRWQIEIFFKWIKQHLRVKHFYGLSRQAVENQLLIALITYCLLVLVKFKTGYRGPLLTIKRFLHTCLYDSFETFVRKLCREPRHRSKGRRKIDHDKIYQETVRQVMDNESELLYDTTYDPVIL